MRIHGRELMHMTSQMRAHILMTSLFYVFTSLLIFCSQTLSEEIPASKLIVLRDLPKGLEHQPAQQVLIRTSYKGSVEIVESDEFRVEINITSPTLKDLTKVDYNYTDYHGSLLFQIFDVEPGEEPVIINYILLLIGGVVTISLIGSCIFVCWWNACKRQKVNEDKEASCPDSSQAPLLDGRILSANQTSSGMSNKVRKRLNKSANHNVPPTDESCISSEEDNMDDKTAGAVKKGAIKNSKKDKNMEMNQIGSSCNSLTRDGQMAQVVDRFSESNNSSLNTRSLDRNHPMAGLRADGAMAVGPDGAPGAPPGSIYGTAARKTGQYIQLAGVTPSAGPERSVRYGPDPVQRTGSLRARRDYSAPGQTGRADPLPSDGIGNRGSSIPRGRTQGGYPDYSVIPGTGGQQVHYISLSGSDRADGPSDERMSEPGYSSINRTMSGRSGKFGGGDGTPPKSGEHRPTVTFSPSVKVAEVAPRGSEADDLDSFGKPRYIEGMHPEGGEPRYATVNSGARARDQGGPGGARNRLVMVDASGGPNPHNAREETYGTMGSSCSSTTSNTSGASTGSGSSGSMVTVVPSVSEAGLRGGLGQNHIDRGPLAVPPAPPRNQIKGGPMSPQYGNSYDSNSRKEGDNKHGNRGSPGGIPNYLQTSVLCSIAVISLLSCGVYARVITETEVHIRMYVPVGFLRFKPEVFSPTDKHVNVTSYLPRHGFNVDKYEVPQPRILDLRAERCQLSACPQHSCDDNTQECICRHGYRLVGNRCEDVDECASDEYVCHKNARCHNLPGSFTCICSDGFYGDGQRCQSCSAPCPNGTFEVMPCSESHPKLCKECSKTCMEGYFISSPCGTNYNTVCKACRSKCGRHDYEYTPCFGTEERQCREVDLLPKPVLSRNAIYENRREVKQVMSYMLQQDSKSGPLTHMLPLNRGSGLTVHITVREANLAPLYRAVNHSDSNDNEGFYEDIRITQEYCPYPIPEKYQLSLVLHQGITTKAQYYACSHTKRSRTKKEAVRTCDMETGYYISPREACETYSKFGRLPSLNTEGWSVLCMAPGKLSDAFGVSAELMDVTTMFVDKTVKCAEQRTNCDECTRQCARNMQSYRGSHRCNITADDADNGESPRLQYCFSCCNKQECSKICEVYHNRECQQVRCITGNLAEVVLSPLYSHRSSMFACHVEPIPHYKIYDIEYSVLHEGRVVNDRKLRAQKLYDSTAGGQQDKAVNQYTFLKVYYSSEVTTRPDLIEGDSLMKSFSAGYYQARGRQVSEAEIKSKTIFVRPKSPFSVSSKIWRREKCDTEVLSDLVVAPSTPPDSEPYRPDPQIDVQFVSASTYRIFNKTQSHLPFMYFELPKDASVLKAVYDPTTVKDDATLKAELIRREREWVLHIAGEMIRCPGAFGITVRDLGYPDQPLFEYDVGVACPNEFSVDFTIPTEGADIYDKTFIVDLTDTYRTIKMTVFRPAPNMTKEMYDFFISNSSHDSPVNFENTEEIPLTIFTPIIAVICVVVLFLSVLLFFGFVTDTDKISKKCENKIDLQHLFFVVCYVTFRATYSVAVTFTILVLLIRHVNRESSSTLIQFPQYAETAGNSQKLDIDLIQNYVTEELRRQNMIANKTKQQCEQKLIQLQDQLEEAKQTMRVETPEDRLVSQVALQYTKLMILNLTNNINKFKQDFTSYAKKALDRLTRSIVQTSGAIQSSKWLAGAKIIHEVVKSKRAAQGLETKPFAEWAGIEQEVDRLVADISLKDFPLPNISEFLNIDIPKINRKPVPIPRASDVILPRNQWYYHYESKPSDGEETAEEKQGSNEAKDRITASDIISLTTLLAVLATIDLIWFIHRMARTYSTAKMVLYGCPVYVSCKKTSEGLRDSEEENKSSPVVRCLHYLKDLNLRIMKTEFVPKLVATVTVSCAIYVVLAASDHLLTVETLSSVGYFDALIAPVETSYRLARTRVKMNAHRINRFEYPFYEELVNVRTKRYQLLLEMYAEVQRSTAVLHDSEYCMWRKMLNPDEQCNCTSVEVRRLQFDGCDLPPVLPYPYLRKDFGLNRYELGRSIVIYINAARQVVMETCHLVAIFVGILVLVDALGGVIWIYLKRFNLLKLKPLYEIQLYPTSSLNQTSGEQSHN